MPPATAEIVFSDHACEQFARRAGLTLDRAEARIWMERMRWRNSRLEVRHPGWSGAGLRSGFDRYLILDDWILCGLRTTRHGWIAVTTITRDDQTWQEALRAGWAAPFTGGELGQFAMPDRGPLVVERELAAVCAVLALAVLIAVGVGTGGNVLGITRAPFVVGGAAAVVAMVVLWGHAALLRSRDLYIGVGVLAFGAGMLASRAGMVASDVREAVMIAAWLWTFIPVGLLAQGHAEAGHRAGVVAVVANLAAAIALVVV